MKQYIHLIDGKLMVGGEKPNYWEYYEKYHSKVSPQEHSDKLEQALTTWRESLVEVKNAKWNEDWRCFDIILPHPHKKWKKRIYTMRIPHPGQQVQTSEPGRITKIL